MKKESKKNGRPAHQPDDFKRQLVKKLSANGHSQERIASYLQISADTLMKYYAEEFNNGKIEDEIEMSDIVRKNSRMGNQRAAEFVLACRHGWSKTESVELSGKDGGAIKIESEYKQSLAKLLAGIKPEEDDEE